MDHFLVFLRFSRSYQFSLVLMWRLFFAGPPEFPFRWPLHEKLVCIEFSCSRGSLSKGVDIFSLLSFHFHGVSVGDVVLPVQ